MGVPHIARWYVLISAQGCTVIESMKQCGVYGEPTRAYFGCMLALC